MNNDARALSRFYAYAAQVNENIVISGDLNSDLMSGATPIDKPYIVITEWNATILFWELLNDQYNDITTVWRIKYLTSLAISFWDEI